MLPKKKQNDKYITENYHESSIECIDDFLHENGFYMQQTFFEIGEEEILRNQQSDCVKGNLKRHIKFWEEIGASDFILETIRNGYIIPFYESPEQSFNVNNKSARDNLDFVKEAVSELVKKGMCSAGAVQTAYSKPINGFN